MQPIWRFKSEGALVRERLLNKFEDRGPVGSSISGISDIGDFLPRCNGFTMRRGSSTVLCSLRYSAKAWRRTAEL